LNFLLKLFYENRKVKLKPISILIILNLNSPLLLAESGEFFFDMDMGVQSDSNVNQAKLKNDIVDDTVTSGSVTAGYQLSIDNMRAITLSAGLLGKQFKEVSTQNSVSSLIGAAFMWQNNIGYRAPLYQFSIKSEFHNNASKQQDSTIINSQISMSSRLTDVISGTLGFGHKYRDSDSSVYDLTDSRIFASADYVLNKSATLYGTLSLIKGDIFSVSRPDTDAERYIALAAGKNNIQWDEAFNEEFPSEVTRWQAYRINADTQVFVVGFNFGFGHGNSIDLSFTRADVSGEAGADYERNLVNASLLKRF